MLNAYTDPYLPCTLYLELLWFAGSLLCSFPLFSYCLRACLRACMFACLHGRLVMRPPVRHQVCHKADSQTLWEVVGYHGTGSGQWQAHANNQLQVIAFNNLKKTRRDLGKSMTTHSWLCLSYKRNRSESKVSLVYSWSHCKRLLFYILVSFYCIWH